jgi:hypothetical protein
MAPLLTNRWQFLKVTDWRVGVSSSVYTNVGAGSVGRAGFMRSPNPYVELVIPGATTNVLQEINTGKKLEGFIEVTDWNAVSTMLYAVDVDNVTGGNQYAVIPAGNTRTVIDYFVIAGILANIVKDPYSQTTPTASYSFTNTVIGEVPYLLTKPNDPILVTFYADSVTETVA